MAMTPMRMPVNGRERSHGRAVRGKLGARVLVRWPTDRRGCVGGRMVGRRGAVPLAG